MTDDPFEQLARHAREPVPPPDSSFVDRLESDLRAQHAAHEPTRRPIAALLPRLGIAFAVVLIGVVGALAFGGRDAGVPVSVIDDEPIAPAEQPAVEGGQDETVDNGSQGSSEAVVVPPPTATPTPAGSAAAAEANDAGDDAGEPPQPTAGASPTEPPAPVERATPAPTATEAALASPTPIPTASPTPTSVVAPLPTALSTPPATDEPVPTATAIPSPTPTPEPTATPTLTATPEPTATVEPAEMNLACAVRTADAAVAVVCSWAAPRVDVAVTHYELWRSRNGGDAQVVARQRAVAPTNYVDRDVAFGDEVTYLIRALASQGQSNDDQIVAASIRQVIQLPAS